MSQLQNPGSIEQLQLFNDGHYVLQQQPVDEEFGAFQSPTAAFKEATIVTRRPDGSLKRRTLMIPDKETMGVHRGFLEAAYTVEIPNPYATAAAGNELLDNIRPHKGNRHFYLTDLRDAFPNVNKQQLLRIAASCVDGAARNLWLEFITNYAFAPGVKGLPLGAPASPFLFNLYCLPMDEVLGEYCQEHGVTYTRYLDDLSFSAETVIGGRKRKAIRVIIEKMSGLDINHRKSKVHSLDRGPVTITGISIYPDGRIQPSPQVLDDAREAFLDVFARIAMSIKPDEETVGRAHGYHGAIDQLSDGDPQIIQDLNNMYREILTLI